MQAQNMRLNAPLTKFLLPIIGVSGLCGGGFYLYQTEHSTFGLIAGIMSSFGLLFILIQLLPNANSLNLDSQGLTIRAFFRDQRYLWKQIQEFQVGKIGLNEMVLFILTAEFKNQSEADREASAFMQNINGFDGALPSTYGRTAPELCALLNSYRERAL